MGTGAHALSCQRVSWWVAVAVVVAAITGAGAAGHHATARQPNTPLVVSPTEAPSFASVTVSGAGCTGPAPRVGVSLSDGGPTEANWGLIGMYQSPTPDATGGWAALFEVNPLLQAGDYVFTAKCFPEGFRLTTEPPPPEWPYTDTPFRVTNGPQAGWDVTAGAGAAHLLATGFGCIEPGATVEVRLTGTTERNYDSGYGGGSATPRPDGTWQATVSVDTEAIGYMPGMPLSAHADCTAAEHLLIYPPVTVTAPDAIRPAPPSLSFTG
jgi:hypothetical protein